MGVLQCFYDNIVKAKGTASVLFCLKGRKMHSIISEIDLCGGRGASYSQPNGSNDNFASNGVGPKVSSTLKGAIGKKGSPIGIEKAYKDANPNYDRTGTYAEYTTNCQRCVVAYELRRRGYDVTALPKYEGDTLGRVTRIDRNDAIWSRWQGAFRSAKPETVKARTSKKVVKNIEEKMKSYGDGSRGVVTIMYKNSNTGHVFNVEQRKGKTYFVDAQSGQRMWAKNYIDIVDTRTVTLTRTDNLRISDRAKNFVTSEDIYKRRK